ncbi:ABC transporter permease [Yinghuangia soli]|uniref:ABC transporter permease n=1 Tax=Yinghuangia soli TaxID=2908204 RepID=A0AA41TZQ7_9ACTN|nr:ABC transporter permease [Yinghuangia soli]MCF2527761.1 ABC transporter permease [Yinghuangia soli]
MFIAMRDLRAARGRFALLGTVVALMVLMVVMLSGLTAGLGNEGISGLKRLPVGDLAFQKPPKGQDLSFTGSTVTRAQWEQWQGRPGVVSAQPLGVSTNRVTGPDGRAAAATFFGTVPETGLAPEPTAGRLPGPGEILMPEQLAEDAGVAVGGRVTVSGIPLTVAGFASTGSFSHTPVAYVPFATWQQITRSDGATAVALELSGGADTKAADAAAGTVTVAKDDAYDAVGGYAAERGSLLLIQGLLLLVSALVVGAFFTVWTIQRGRDLAVVRAMGASRGYLLRDALAQALMVLVAGGLLGAAAGTALGSVASQFVPFVSDASTVLVPLGAMTALGLVGAALAVRKVVTVDPITALGAAR